MRVLLDECLPRKLKRLLAGHYVSTVPEMGWASISNGTLLRLMEPVVDVFATIDGNMQYQQHLSAFKVGIIVLAAPDNSIETLSTLVDQILQTLNSIAAGQVVRISVCAFLGCRADCKATCRVQLTASVDGLAVCRELSAHVKFVG